MKKKFKFQTTDATYDFVPPMPSSRATPTWFRSMPGVYEGVETIKKCVPFLDSFTVGYTITSTADVYFNGKDFEFNTVFPVISLHTKEQTKEIPLSKEFLDQPFKWINVFGQKTPKGYSTLFVHPMNRIDLPFFSLGAVVDTDSFNVPVNFPFFMKKGFEGIIPAGTPIIQAIPFKREDWEIEVDTINSFEMPKDYFNHANPPFNYYKRKYWTRKRYS